MRIVFGLFLIALVGIAGLAGLAWRPAIDPIEPQPSTAFAPSLVRRGETLAAIGDCGACHNAPGQPAYSGGLPVETPFGVVYASNLTPDPQTGIGRWSETAFRRAMREGLDREGRQLYPAFPYDHYTHVTDADDAALYAYLMTRAPDAHPIPQPNLVFPLGFRPLVAGWKLLFLRPGPLAATAGEDEVSGRGRYLVDGLGHCGACHSPHNLLGAERGDRPLAGGVAEGWNAYALNGASPAPIPWTEGTLAFYLSHGWQTVHGISRGPMAAVTANLARAPAADVAAMARYLVARMGDAAEGSDRARRLQAGVPAPRPAASAGAQAAVSAAADDSDRGAAIYAGACASCHESGRPVPFGGLPLALSSALHAPDPTNIVTVTLHGLRAAPGEASAIMPGFDGTLDDDQIARLLSYLRGSIAHEAPWPDLPDVVRKARMQAVTLFPSDGVSTAPADTDLRVAP